MSVKNYSIKDNIIKFQLNNSKGIYKNSYPNALRRILISYIDCYTIDVNSIKFIENNSLFNNEFLKQRLSLIPIISNNNDNYEFLDISCEKRNDIENIDDIFTSEFKIKDRTTDKELKIENFISDLDILFSKLQINQNIKFEASFKKGNAFNNGSTYSPVSSCVVTFHNSNYDKEEVIQRERNYDLNQNNDPYIYEFYYENIGFFKSEELIKLACDILITKLKEFKGKMDNLEYENDFYTAVLNNENDTIGNLFTRYLLDNKEIIYCGYNIVHPLKNDIFIKIKIDGKKDKLFKIIEKTTDQLINMTEKLKKEFK